MVSFNMSSVSTTVTEYIKARLVTPHIVNSTLLLSSTVQSSGYNYIDFTSSNMLFPKGSMIQMRANYSSGIAINRLSSLPYSDFDAKVGAYISNGISTWASYLKIYTRAVDSTVKAKNYTFNIWKPFASAGNYSLIASTSSCSNTNLSQTVNVTVSSGKFI